MSTLIYYVAASLDGYIATTEHQLDWLEQFELGEDAASYEEFYQGIEAVIMGGETYRWIIHNTSNNWSYQTVPAFIFTQQQQQAPLNSNIRIMHEAPSVIASEARKVAQGKDIWLVGGGKTTTCSA